MKYTCPDCEKTYTVNYCDDCKKIIESPTDKSHKNAALLWGIILVIAGFFCVGFALLGQMQQNPNVYLLYIGISVAPVGFVLLGIGAIVDRLNTIINMIKENKNDKS